MRRLALAAALLLPLALPVLAADPDVAAAPSCHSCGMDREKFAASRMTIEYEDGTTVGLCSVHCAAVDLANQIDKAPRALRVGDAATKQLVDAERATWVIGGSKQGVMSRRAKWAFADEAAAKAFVKEFGGTLATFEDVMKATYEDMYADTRMIREKRKAMRARAAEAAR